MNSAGVASVAGDDDLRVRDLLVDSLALWQVAATVEAGTAGTMAVIHARQGMTVSIEHVTGPDMPFRWRVCSYVVGDSTAHTQQARPRTCNSVVGLLSAVRKALGVERGSPLRVVPA